VVPTVLRLVQPEPVVDVGCGDGAWLSVFRELGVNHRFGLDGDYVDRRLLQIPQDQFSATDLSLPFRLPCTFDLAVSLEVAEHLPPQSAEDFVDSLTRLAPVVLFSAAIPLQGGTHHLNEQWPDY
jgi:SAM-dependent methyltransferase